MQHFFSQGYKDFVHSVSSCWLDISLWYIEDCRFNKITHISLSISRHLVTEKYQVIRPWIFQNTKRTATKKFLNHFWSLTTYPIEDDENNF